MARGFTLQDIACLNLEDSAHGTSASAAIASKCKCGEGERDNSCQSRSSFHQQMQDHRDESDGSGSGLIASSLKWFDKKREKQRREHLKLEAEKQLQKIGEAQRASHRESSASAAGGCCTSSVLRNYSLADSDSSTSSQENLGGDGGCDLVANHSLVSTASLELGGEVIVNRFPDKDKNGKLQYLAQKSNSFGTSDVSKSGEGASGMLDLSDIDGLIDEEKNSDDGSIIPPVRVTHVDGDEASPYILSQNEMNEISKHVLPETITYCRWRRLYGLGRDGDSFDGCLRIIGTVKRTLMVVRTTKGDIFGGYADAPWHSRHASATAKFYGSASSCLFSFSSTRTPMSTSSSPESSPINVYRWTGKNRYIQVCDVSNKMLAFGGGGDKGAFGLCLQEDFQRGTTGHCDTFDNDPLGSGFERTFDIVDVEFWEFLTGVF